ncbi:MAG: recombination mediator RecR [bacterium]
MSSRPEPFSHLVSELEKLPGIGPKSAQRLAFYIIESAASDARELADAIVDAKKKIKYCSICFNLTEHDPCGICQDQGRDKSKIAIVAEPRDLLAIERSREYDGLYHVLGGIISPLDGIGPDNLRIPELLRRLEDGKVTEVIFALNPNVEGEATTLYLMKVLKPLGLKITRIAYGLPVGGDLDYADEVTLAKSFEGRKELR